MIKELQLRLVPSEAANEQSLRQTVCVENGLKPEEITAVRVLKRSIDARQKQVFVNLTVRVFINEEATEELFQKVEYKDVSSAKKQVVIVGAGPAGLFAALRLIELGAKPVIVERGKDVHERKHDIASISIRQKVYPESNYCFGEGGAGAFSDGKLFTRSHKRGSVDRILNIFCQHGADTSILCDVHPHIGTDKLPRVIENMRETIIEHGGEVHFSACMQSLIINENEVQGVRTVDGREFLGRVILATGHSASDVYKYFASENIEIESKDFALGVRLEHPQELIDRIRYHSKDGRGKYLPPAEYSFTAQSGGRGVFSFCMCPGGFVIPSASGPNELVVNGMSPSHRGSKWANAGIVVEIKRTDVSPDPLSLLKYREFIEKGAWYAGGMCQSAPAQRMVDFVNGYFSHDLPASSYTPGLTNNTVHKILPEGVVSRLRDGFQQFDKVSKGFLTNEAVVIGVETRTSSPVRILRHPETMQHIRLKGLFPCGEGAGYAGGIVSSAIDGELAADAAFA